MILQGLMLWSLVLLISRSQLIRTEQSISDEWRGAGGMAESCPELGIIFGYHCTRMSSLVPFETLGSGSGCHVTIENKSEVK